MTKKNAVFIYSDQLLSYHFSDQHPFNQIRLKITLDLLFKMKAITNNELIEPRMASEEELLLNHDRDFIEAVKLAGKGQSPPGQADKFGIGTNDTPIFTNMHEASSWIVGGTLTAVDEVMQNRADHALHLGGGLHHSFRGKASGFCVYNDCAVAIKYIQQKYQARVLYIDTDAHHGDGVQASFYDDDRVCTLSIHETGKYLFPGTGQVNDWGHDKGYGYSFNVPLEPFTEDESFIQAYSTALHAIADYFKPDVILTQNGVDAHYYDPLTHLSSTMKTYRQIPKLAHEVAHRYCDGRWIAVGGGGYDIWRVVPRAWSLIWLEMIDQYNVTGRLPETWIQQWAEKASTPLIGTWEDPADIYSSIPRKTDIEEKNKQIVDRTLYIIKKQR